MIDTRIHSVSAMRVWDSRGRPTVEAEVRLGDGSRGRAIAPAGARAANPALDVTPHRYITAIVTEQGPVRPPFEAGLRAAVAASRGKTVPALEEKTA